MTLIGDASCRLSTVRSADCTVVMDAGRIVEEGTHDSLLAQGNIYAMLVRRQTGSAMDAARPRDDDEPSAALKAEVITTHLAPTWHPHGTTDYIHTY